MNEGRQRDEIFVWRIGFAVFYFVTVISEYQNGLLE